MTITPAYRGRFAPSPTGPLHLGSLLAALGSWLLARQAGGTWLVRIEDLDPPREVEGAAEAQLGTLAALGLESDEPVVRQSQRSRHYQDALDRLVGAGHAFECRCSRSDLATAGGIHRRCVDTPSGQSPAVRVRVNETDPVCFDDALQGRYCQPLEREVGDFVVRRADGLWAYQLAVVVDDDAQEVTDVVRGVDLIDSTPRQILLQRLLGMPTPRYLHLPLVRGPDGGKLSKSLHSAPVDADDPMPALRAAWALLGQAAMGTPDAREARAWLRQAVERFDPRQVPRTIPAPFAGP